VFVCGGMWVCDSTLHLPDNYHLLESTHSPMRGVSQKTERVKIAEREEEEGIGSNCVKPFAISKVNIKLSKNQFSVLFSSVLFRLRLRLRLSVFNLLAIKFAHFWLVSADINLHMKLLFYYCGIWQM